MLTVVVVIDAHGVVLNNGLREMFLLRLEY